MNCPFCGQPIENLAKGACEQCCSEASKSSTSIPIVELDSASSSMMPNLRQSIAVAAIFVLLASIGVIGSRPSSFNYRLEDTELVLTDSAGKPQLSYELQEERRFKVAVMQFDQAPELLKSFGMQLTLVYLSQKDLQTYQRNYIEQGRCPAEFMNSRSKVLQLIVDNKELLQKLRGKSWPEGTPLELHGQYLTISESPKNNLGMSVNLSGNFRIFHLKSIKF